MHIGKRILEHFKVVYKNTGGLMKGLNIHKDSGHKMIHEYKRDSDSFSWYIFQNDRGPWYGWI